MSGLQLIPFLSYKGKNNRGRFYHSPHPPRLGSKTSKYRNVAAFISVKLFVEYLSEGKKIVTFKNKRPHIIT